MSRREKITAPDDAALSELCEHLAKMAIELDRATRWPAEQLRLCGEYGVYEWFIDPRWGGQGWNEADVVQGYLALSAACVTTTFILTQRTGACRRIAGSGNDALKQRLLPDLASGQTSSGRSTFATVGISHLTTSRRHLAQPVLTAERVTGGFRLDGMAPWVTGGAAADVIVIAATLVNDGAATDEQLIMAVPTGLPGVRVAEPLPLVGVSASATGPVHLDQVEVADDWLIAGPMPNVMTSGVGASTGGLETSTLAVGLAGAAISYLQDEATRRTDLQQPATALRADHTRLVGELLGAACGDTVASRVVRGSPDPALGGPVGRPATTSADIVTTKESLRQRANSLVLRATQAALSAAKGSGYVVGHPAGRWCREALFFLVWSCPQPVAAANLCELAGIQD
jgi:alkylation response protein AidB-like acyl-CoA dehydrogenase